MTPNEISEFARAIGTVYDGEAAPRHITQQLQPRT